jgi:hypothetical protein
MRKLIPITLLLFASLISANPLSWQTFSNGKISWIYNGISIFVYSSDSRSVYPLVLDQTRTTGAIHDIIEYEQTLLISTDAGIYQIDMSTQAIERITFSDDINRTGKLASDMDYLWLSTEDTLFRFDKLGREWQSFPIPEKFSKCAIISDGTTVECLGQNVLYTFTTGTEKWNRFSSDIASFDSSYFIKTSKTITQISANRLYIYVPNSQIWEQIKSDNRINDAWVESDVTYFSTSDKIYKLEKNTILKQLDINISEPVSSFTKNNFDICISLKSKLMFYNTTKSELSFLDYPAGKTDQIPNKIVYKSDLLLFYDNSISVYNFSSKTWSETESKQRTSQSKASWTDAGPMFQYRPGFYTSIKGFIESKSSLKSAGFVYDSVRVGRDSLNNPIYAKDSTDSTLLVKWVKPDLIADINIHTADPDGRTLDLTFNNTNNSVPATKEIVYKGATSDILQLVRGGTCETDVIKSKLSVPITYEGLQVGLDTKSKLKDKDRKIARFTGGAGVITSRSNWKVLKYRADGNYQLESMPIDTLLDTLSDSLNVDTTALSIVADSLTQSKDTVQLLPGTVRVWIDGIELDSKYFAFYRLTNSLQISSDAPVDPSSLISVTYKVQPLPRDGNEEIEFKPYYNFGKTYYGTGTISPLSWLSVRGGVESFQKDSSQSIVNFAVPVEYRKESPNLLFKVTPEYSYNAQTSSSAGAIDIQSRIGKNLGITFDGLVADSRFSTADTFTHGFGKIKNEYNFSVNYNIKPEIPVTYTQHRFSALDGTESGFNAQSGIHYQGYPFLDFDISRVILDDNANDTNHLFDSIFHIKDRFMIKLYETPSPFLLKLTHFQKIKYEITHTEYRFNSLFNDDFKSGRSTFGKMTLNPVQPVTCIISGDHKQGDLGNNLTKYFSPSLQLVTVEFPKGVDFTGTYSGIGNEYAGIDSSNVIINRQLALTLRPGRWYNKLGWFSLNGSLKETVNASDSNSALSFGDFILGNLSTRKKQLDKGIGCNVFLNQFFFLSNQNTWSEADSSETFSSNNNFKFYFNSKNNWNNTVDYATDFDAFSFKGLTEYNWRTFTWLQLKPSFEVAYSEDSSSNKQTISPQLEATLSMNKWLFIKSLTNLHSLKLQWNKVNNISNANPDLEYVFMLILHTLPNIILNNQNSFTFSNGGFSNFKINLMCTITF